MSICYSGINCKIQSAEILINISEQHPLIQLGKVIQWQELADFVIADLKNTPAGKWWFGRKLKLRIHLGIYLLQQLFNQTDRQIEYNAKDNAAYQIFCGLGIVDKWHVPDHTKIEKFRSRLNTETQKKIANHIAVCSVKLGFGNPENLDIDSTVQEANMAYPADSCLLKKLGVMCSKTAVFLNKTVKNLSAPLKVNIKKISSVAREYFFLPKKSSIEVKSEKLTSLLKVTAKEIQPVIDMSKNLKETFLKKIPWNYRRTIQQIRELASQYLKDVKTFLKEGYVVSTKRLSFHLKEVVCFTKGKLGKKYQFGRAFQLGRIGGNFFIVEKCTSIHMSDKLSVAPMIEEHKNLFGEKIKSVATDKGYYSHKNEQLLLGKGVDEIGIQRPHNIKRKKPKPLTKEREEELGVKQK